jgi:hypothetical protein
MLTLSRAGTYTVTVAPGGIPGVFVRIAGDSSASANRTEVGRDYGS